ncbi:NrsF family protein [Sphingobium ummariense]|uniref:DUF1109 domain-containing protein n=1 Tax=Sphingobium ummariense RL-3 TaxID=1346791 RepID=T0JZS1_9SPHN|nr:DUF1109 domain-containing protein [Sphingobium ummariense]EQB29744.1 hypothetical protein M529_23485 [Sphingobium ummariense RL-3]
MSNESLIIDLSANLTQVQRRNMLREAGLVLGIGALELALFLALGLMRHDMHHIPDSPFLMWRVASLGLLAVVACTCAIRSFSPTARPARGVIMAAAVGAAAIFASLFVAPEGVAERTLLERTAPASGVLCAASIFVLSLPVVTVLGALMRRAAPTQPKLSALASGIAAGACGAFVFAFCCPFNDPLYVVVWYSVGCAAVTAAARWRLPRRFSL